ncbi:MAG TPA: glycosyltransferase family 1 protein [Novosphingobium sp.]|nr:glycosyltransferase family 1 protein [Novosphingobium sp.]
MSCAVAYDLTRLFLGPLSTSPRGIDRVDLVLAQHFFADGASPHLGILPTPWGIRAFPAGMVRRGLDHLRELWAEQIDESADSVWATLRAVLGAGSAQMPACTPPQKAPQQGKAARMFAHLRRTGIAPGQSAVRQVPRGAAYLNVGQIGLAVPLFHRWLSRRADIAAVVMLHDAIPLDYPQLVEPGSVAHHGRMIATAARHADGIVTTTEHAAQSVSSALGRLGRWQVPTCVRALPLHDAFALPRHSHPDLAGAHYFVTCSTVEPRKNHALLIECWGRLVAQMGAGAPHLVIAGAPGWNAGAILALAADPALRGRVHHVTGLSSPALAQLMLGAAAVLCPSLAEGFGLTLLEANALGVPTIASDIGAHREVANATTHLLPPDAADQWTQAIAACPPAHPRLTPALPATLSGEAYCNDIAAFLARCASAKNGKDTVARNEGGTRP